MSKGELDYFDYFTKKEKRNIQKTRKYFSKELEFCKETIDLLFDAFKSAFNSYSEKWSHSKKACLFILPRIIMSAKTSLELLIRGYYFDYIVVQRSLMESIALLALLSKDEEKAKKWLNFEKLEISKFKLIHQLHPSPTKKLITLANKMYAEQCDYVHSNFVAIIAEFSRHTNRRVKYLEFPKFEKSLIGEAIDSPLSALALLFLIDAYQDELEKSFRTKVKNFVGEKISEWKAEGLIKN